MAFRMPRGPDSAAPQRCLYALALADTTHTHQLNCSDHRTRDAQRAGPRRRRTPSNLALAGVSCFCRSCALCSSRSPQQARWRGPLRAHCTPGGAMYARAARGALRTGPSAARAHLSARTHAPPAFRLFVVLVPRRRARPQPPGPYPGPQLLRLARAAPVPPRGRARPFELPPPPPQPPPCCCSAGGALCRARTPTPPHPHSTRLVPNKGHRVRVLPFACAAHAIRVFACLLMPPRIPRQHPSPTSEDQKA